MKTYISIVLTLILFSLIGIGFILYRNFGIGSDNILANRPPRTMEADGQTPSENITNDEVKEIEEPAGSISGEICYPSEGIPPLNVYFKEVVTLDVIEMPTELNQSEYEINDIPTGTYVAYAYVDGIDGDGGGYTQAVECGLTIDCEDHTLIEFEVLEDEVISGIDVCDWYGAEIPEEL